MTSAVRCLWKRGTDFFFPIESDRWLSILRIGLGLQVTMYAWSARADWLELFSRNGQALINRELTEKVLSVQSPLAPRLGWLIWLGGHIGVSEPIILWSAWFCLLCAGYLLVSGLFCRPAAVIAWFIHVCATKSEHFLSYGMDNFTTIGLFYLMLAPLPDRISLDALLWKSHAKDPHLVGFFRRVLQVHLCFIYFFGGITKCAGVEWWNGTSIWRVMTSPPYNLISPEILVSWRYLLPFLGIAICLLETGYPLFIWPKRTRIIWLACILGMHVTIGLTMGLYLFSLIMIVLNLAAFGPGLLRAECKETSIRPQEAVL
jgi:uncharacterized membrane protein YphA (DoxX/SURF4 family)